MVSFARLCYGIRLYYWILTFIVIYFLFRSASHSDPKHVSAEYENLLKNNSEYMKMCSKWESSLNGKNTATKLKPLPLIKDDPELSPHFHCDISDNKKRISQRGNYYVIHNFVRASAVFGCTSSITLSAPGDYRFLDNLIPLVERWQGPISIALYAPGSDFFTTIEAIAYLRTCETDLIKKFVTFHVFFDQDHVPRHNGPPLFNSYKDTYDCFVPPPWADVKDEDMYKMKNNLLYPINVARNVAKSAAQTYFVFPNDIELYPTRNFIPLFLKFVKNNLKLFAPGKRNVFVLPIFEVLEKQKVPENKTELQAMLKEETAIVFHQAFCDACHKVIDNTKWVEAKETKDLGVSSAGKRIGAYRVWEPFYVCTQNEPLWDERMTWEGQNNKMVQAYTMCVMNYDFHVLDNAFLIHRPGVKKKKVQMEKFMDLVENTRELFNDVVSIEIQELYGYNANCSTYYKKPKKKKSKGLIEKKTEEDTKKKKVLNKK